MATLSDKDSSSPCPRRPLAPGGPSVSLVGLGTVKIGRNRGVKYPGGDGFPLPDDKTVDALLDTALELGINLLDTAPAYGTSEQRLGKLLGQRRERFFLVSKVGEEFVDGLSHYDFSRQFIEASVARSLVRLATERLDALLLHCPHDDMAVVTQSDALATLHDLKQRGDVGLIGISSHTPEAALAALPHVDLVMVTCNPGDQRQLPVIARAAAAGKGVLIKKALDSGHLALTGTQRRAALAATAAIPGVSSLVLGTTSPAHLRDNVAAVCQAGSEGAQGPVQGPSS